MPSIPSTGGPFVTHARARNVNEGENEGKGSFMQSSRETLKGNDSKETSHGVLHGQEGVLGAAQEVIEFQFETAALGLVGHPKVVDGMPNQTLCATRYR